MSQPLGDAIGNALDVAEAIGVLRGEQGGRLAELSVLFAAAAEVSLQGRSPEEAERRARDELASGRAAEVFARMIESQGGDPAVVERPAAVLPAAPVVRAVTGAEIVTGEGRCVESVDAELLGRAAAALGAGRARKGDEIDPAVGLVFRPKVGDVVEPEAPVLQIHARSDDAAAGALEHVRAALRWSEGPVEPPPLVYGWRDA